jgi:hypothetical protein
VTGVEAALVVAAVVLNALVAEVAATFGLGMAAELIVGVKSDPVVPAVAMFDVVGGPAANMPGVTLAAAVVGVSSAGFAVPTFDVVAGPAANMPGVTVVAAVVGVSSAGLAVTIVEPAMVLAAVAAGVDDVGAIVAAPVPAAAGTAAKVAAPASPLVMTGVGSELIDAFTVSCGFATYEGGMTCPVTYCSDCGDCAPAGPTGPRIRSR